MTRNLRLKLKKTYCVLPYIYNLNIFQCYPKDRIIIIIDILFRRLKISKNIQNNDDIYLIQFNFCFIPIYNASMYFELIIII